MRWLWVLLLQICVVVVIVVTVAIPISNPDQSPQTEPWHIVVAVLCLILAVFLIVKREKIEDLILRWSEGVDK